MIKDFAAANHILAGYAPPPLTSGAVLILDRMRALLAYLDDPQEKFKVIHVAGTSGKTSTVYYIAAFLNAAGRKVGHTVSPHVYEVNERVQINLEPLSEKAFTAELAEFLVLIKKAPVKPTYFELIVAFALWEFAKQQVDYAVIEVGLGGRLDTTNIFTQADKIAVITDIGLDHIHILGNTLGAIAAEKAGIIQSGNTVFTFRQDSEVRSVIAHRVHSKGADLHEVIPSYAIEASTLPVFQQRNYTLAKEVYEFTAKHDGLSTLADTKLHEVLDTYIPARMETFRYQDKTIILDGAHNAQKLQALAESLRHKYPDASIATLLAFVDKKVQKSEDVTSVIRLSQHIITTGFTKLQDMRRGSMDAAALGRLCLAGGANSIEIIPESDKALKTLLERPEKVLLVTGSFFLLDHLSPMLATLKP